MSHRSDQLDVDVKLVEVVRQTSLTMCANRTDLWDTSVSQTPTEVRLFSHKLVNFR
jgi:hypothetical protein